MGIRKCVLLWVWMIACLAGHLVVVIRTSPVVCGYLLFYFVASPIRLYRFSFYSVILLEVFKIIFSNAVPHTIITPTG